LLTQIFFGKAIEFINSKKKEKIDSNEKIKDSGFGRLKKVLFIRLNFYNG